MLESRFDERRGRSQKAVEIVREVPCLFTSELVNLSKNVIIPIVITSEGKGHTLVTEFVKSRLDEQDTNFYSKNRTYQGGFSDIRMAWSASRDISHLISTTEEADTRIFTC